MTSKILTKFKALLERMMQTVWWLLTLDTRYYGFMAGFALLSLAGASFSSTWRHSTGTAHLAAQQTLPDVAWTWALLGIAVAQIWVIKGDVGLRKVMALLSTAAFGILFGFFWQHPPPTILIVLLGVFSIGSLIDFVHLVVAEEAQRRLWLLITPSLTPVSEESPSSVSPGSADTSPNDKSETIPWKPLAKI